jgi:hypothetical protein
VEGLSNDFGQELFMIRALGCLFFFGWVGAASAGTSWTAVQTLWGQKGLETDRGLLLTFPRSDLNVMIDGIPLDPAMGLTSRILLEPQEKGVRIQGEWVLLDQEMGRVEAKLFLEGFEITEVGSFLEGETPAVKRIVFTARGDGYGLSMKLKTILNVSGTPWGPMEVSTPAVSSPEDWSLEEAEFGQKGTVQGKTLELSFPGSSPAGADGFDASNLVFEKNGDRLLVVGKLLVPQEAVPAVLKILARKKILVTSLSEEMSPAGALARIRLWGSGSVEDLIPALKKALAELGKTQDLDGPVSLLTGGI